MRQTHYPIVADSITHQRQLNQRASGTRQVLNQRLEARLVLDEVLAQVEILNRAIVQKCISQCCKTHISYQVAT